MFCAAQGGRYGGPRRAAGRPRVPLGGLRAAVRGARAAGAAHREGARGAAARRGLLLPVALLPARSAPLQRALQAAHPHARALRREAQQVPGA